MICAAAAAAAGLAFAPFGIPHADAAPCPDIEVVFARGTTEPPGVGGIGQAFVDSVRSDVGGRSVGVYAVDYPASTDFPTAADGVVDASDHIRSMAVNCPQTKMVLGGYSQGAAVIGYVTADTLPAGYTAGADIEPLPADIADNVAAVALFGKPSSGFLDVIGAPPITVGSSYAGKTIDLCAPRDPICSPGGDRAAHSRYAVNGMVAQAADAAVARL